MITYKKLETNIEEVPLKMQVEIFLVTYDIGITKPQITEVLYQEFELAKSLTGTKYHEHPTHYFIRLYSDVEKIEGIGSQSLGRLQFIKGDSEPQLHFDEIQLNSLNINRETKNGLTFKQRMNIWEVLFNFEDSTHFDDLVKQAQDQSLEFIIEKYKITKELCDNIIREGFNSGWPVPRSGINKQLIPELWHV